MIFYSYFRSSAAYRCRIAFHILGVEPEMRYVHLGKGEQSEAAFGAINPQHLVPALDLGGRVITQSLAIIEYLNETQNGALLSEDAFARAQIRAFAQIIACDIHPLQNLRVLQYIAAEFGQTEAEQKDRWCQKWLGDGLKACEAIASRQNGAFVFGDHPTLADVCLVPQMFSAERFHVDTSAMPRLNAIYKNALEHAAFANAAPAQQKDATSDVARR